MELRIFYFHVMMTKMSVHKAFKWDQRRHMGTLSTFSLGYVSLVPTNSSRVNLPTRVFRIALEGRRMRNFGGGFFYRVMGIWRWVILTIRTFFKAKKHSVNIEHRLKSKLPWPECTNSMKLKWKWYRSNDYS